MKDFKTTILDRVYVGSVELHKLGERLHPCGGEWIDTVHFTFLSNNKLAFRVVVVRCRLLGIRVDSLVLVESYA